MVSVIFFIIIIIIFIIIVIITAAHFFSTIIKHLMLPYHSPVFLFATLKDLRCDFFKLTCMSDSIYLKLTLLYNRDMVLIVNTDDQITVIRNTLKDVIPHVYTSKSEAVILQITFCVFL